jgi:hypothetical protein
MATQRTRRATSIDMLPNIVGASALCSASIIEFTIPQIIRLSQATADPLPAAPLFPHRAALMARLLGPQTVLTVAQFVAVRELRDAFDAAAGPSTLNFVAAYGLASVPLIAAKYNLIIGGVYAYSGRPAPAKAADGGPIAAAAAFWRRKIAPGLLWSFLRDSCSVGGGITLGPLVSRRIAQVTGDEGPAVRFTGGLIAGAGCGLATQLFHNTALTAGRMAETTGAPPGTVECLQRTLAEHGRRAFYLNFQFRVAIIAFWSAVLNVATPFAKERSI